METIFDLDRKEKSKAYCKRYRLQNSEKLSASKREYRLKNAEKINAQNKEYKHKNAEIIKAKNKEYKLLNAQKIKAQRKEYYLQNAEKENTRNNEYYHQNAEMVKAKKKKYVSQNRDIINSRERKRCQEDPLYRAISNLRRRIRGYCSSIRLEKNFTTIESIGCTAQELKIHIQGLFQDGMTWDNYGRRGWVIDHIKPLYLAKTLDEAKKLNHYTNLQPLWWLDNLLKSNKYEEPIGSQGL